MLDFLQDNKYFPPNGWKGVNEPLLHCQRKLFNFQGVGGWVRQNKKCSLHFFLHPSSKRAVNFASPTVALATNNANSTQLK